MARLATLKPRIATASTTRAHAEPQMDYSFYKSKEWRLARAIAVGLARGRCCKCSPSTPPPARVFVDHIVELQDGGEPYDQDNLQVLCGSHHTLKTAKVRAERQLKT